jgi:hypothetical protein
MAGEKRMPLIGCARRPKNPTDRRCRSRPLGIGRKRGPPIEKYPAAPAAVKKSRRPQRVDDCMSPPQGSKGGLKCR